MGKIVPLEGDALPWARARFARYYERTPIPPPSALPEREFAAFPFGAESGMRRHAALPNAEAFHRFLTSVVPRHVYYSSAYYVHPEHPTMPGKIWQGADVVFDLDADHLRQSEGLNYAAQLALVKEQLKRLYDDFLTTDFGLDPTQAEIVFSGGRGYHVHVRDERFRGLTSPARRELVDYLQGSETDLVATVLEERHADGAGGPARRFRRLSPPDAPGWKGRTTRGLQAILARWEAEGPDVAASEMIRSGMAVPDAKRLARALLKDGGAAKIRSTLALGALPREIPLELLAIVLKSATVEVQGETDAPVTTDIHRLIRLPGSLHGGTGFRVLPVARDALDAFDPFEAALYPGDPEATVAVTLLDTVDHPFRERISGSAGRDLELPEAEALFLVLRGEASLRGPGPPPP